MGCGCGGSGAKQRAPREARQAPASPVLAEHQRRSTAHPAMTAWPAPKVVAPVAVEPETLATPVLPDAA